MSSIGFREGKAVPRGKTIRRRAICISESCPVKSFTVYEDEDYPHRLFTIDFAVNVILAILFQGLTYAQAATNFGCSRWSIGRWIQWVTKLVDIHQLHATYLQFDETGVPPSLQSEKIPDWRQGSLCHCAAEIINGMEQLALLMYKNNVLLQPTGSGLLRIIKYQYKRYNTYYPASRLSPSMHLRF